MKNHLYLLLLLLPCLLQSQENCQGSFTEYYLNSNNIRASFFPRGNKFTDGEHGGFLVPYPSTKKLSTIFASSVWIGGFDDTGNLRMAAERYLKPDEFDFTVGPLNSIGLPHYSSCEYFDKAWSVFSEDITLHMEDFYEDFKIDDTIPSIFGWPGRGNKYFARFNGFELPPGDVQGLADFLDTNGNGLYDPDAGDYPALYLFSQYFIPDQMMWMVFNDVDTLNPSGNTPIRAEFQLTAFAFHCQDKPWLNNTIFNKYKIIYRGLSNLNDVFFGLWADYDLGCSADDFMGSDSARNTEFVYNADIIDGDVDADCTTGGATYADMPPVQSMTWLKYPMHSFITEDHETGFPPDKYNYLKGLWGDGTPIRPHGDGYNVNPALSPTKFLFNGDPRDTSAWAAINVFDEGKEQRSVSSISLGRFDPGEIVEVYTAYMFHSDPSADHLGQITNMYRNVDSLLAMSWYPDDKICAPFPICEDGDCVWPGDFDNNGIADHSDYLMWGVMNGANGPERNGQISWRGHPGDSWSNSYVDINTKHGDGDGNGKVDIEDIQVNKLNFTLTNRYFDGQVNYPRGPEIILSAKPFFNEQGNIEKVNVSAGQDIHDVLGLTFEIEFDTALFYRTSSFLLQNIDTSALYYYEDPVHEKSFRYSFVKMDHSTLTIQSGWPFFVPFNNLIGLRPGLPIPDSTVIRLRNLKAIDAEGNDLHIGSEPIVIYKEGIVGIHDPLSAKTIVYPNPSNGFIQIETAIETEAQLFSLHGQKVRHISKSEIEDPVDVSNLVPGIYILRILAKGESIKVIVQ
jgi:hypothetical protein